MIYKIYQTGLKIFLAMVTLYKETKHKKDVNYIKMF